MRGLLILLLGAISLALLSIGSLGGTWVDDFEYDCSNGIDDDLDGKVDCADGQCNSTISGVVVDDDGNSVSGALVEFFNGLYEVQEFETNASGEYEGTLQCGVLESVASHVDYVETTIENTTIPAQSSHQVNFTRNYSLTPLGQCQPDCTKAGSDYFYEDCHGINSCSFYNQQAASSCHLARDGWVREYNESHYLTCAFGEPTPKQTISADVSCPSETVVKTTSIMRYDGKPVKMVVVVCG